MTVRARRAHHPAIVAPGIRRHGAGWQAVAKVRGERAYSQWPLETRLSEIREWQQDKRAELRTLLPKTAAGTFPHEAEKYLRLPSVIAMPTFDERARHIREWVARVGAVRRRRLTAADVERHRDAMLAEGLAGASVNKRLRALSNLWTKLDGRRAPNPVLEVAECDEPEPEARGLPYPIIETILAAIPDTAIGVKKDGTRTTGRNVARPSKTKARLRVIAYTGLAHAQLKLLTPADVDLEAGTMRVRARRKGKRKRRAQDRPRATVLPLTPQAIDAFKTFDALGCWGPFSNSSMWKAFQRACATLKIDGAGLSPYWFRHSFGTAVYSVTRDLRATGALLGHRHPRTTERYTLAAVPPHLAAAIAAVAPILAPAAPATSENARKSADATEGRQEA